MDPLMFCSIIATYTLIGATEFSPNQMEIQFFDPTGAVAYMYIPRDVYTECLPQLVLPEVHDSE